MIAQKHEKGSVIILVVGVLVLLAMVGITFLFFSFMDRRQSSALVSAAPIDKVAAGVVAALCTNRAADLYISGSTLYGDANSYTQQIDYPQECPADLDPNNFYDQALASIYPYQDGATWKWKHISNINEFDPNEVNEISTTDPNLVDTDGDGIRDARLIDSHINSTQTGGDPNDPNSSRYFYAVRLIDASGLLNVNTAHSTAAASSGTPMPVTNVGMDLLADPTLADVNTALRDALRDALHNARRGNVDPNDIVTYNNGWVVRPNNPAPPTGKVFLPFDCADQLALAWASQYPSTATGRLYETFTAAARSGGAADPNALFRAAQLHLTFWSCERDALRKSDPNQVDPNDPNVRMTDSPHRLDLNGDSSDPNTAFLNMFKGFYNAIPAGVTGLSDSDAVRRKTAAQLAANAMNFRFGNSDPNDPNNRFFAPSADLKTACGVGGETIYGVARQPFITEAWLRRQTDPNGTELPQMSAIELFNPYSTSILLAGMKLNGDTISDFSSYYLDGGDRVVLCSDATKIVVADVNKKKTVNLDLKTGCTLSMPASDGTDVAIGKVSLSDFEDTTIKMETLDANTIVYRTRRRDDDPSRARYCLAEYKEYPVSYCSEDGADSNSTNLGRANNEDLGDADDPAPAPLFIRNGELVNVGDLLRLLYVGPTTDDPLDVTLAGSDKSAVYNCRLNVLGALLAEPTGSPTLTPGLPPACLLGDYFAALIPNPNNTGATDTIYGKVNVNTAPWQVIACLPGLNQLDSATRELVARDIVAYRDLLDNSDPNIGGHNYFASGARDAVITGLRTGPGFAAPGEIAIPLRTVLTSPNNTYSGAGNAYRLAGGTDDGLSDITGDLSKYDIYYAWLSNQITVRSDIYIAYIRVQLGNESDPTGPLRRYVAVIDRNNCRGAADLPRVLLLAEIK